MNLFASHLEKVVMERQQAPLKMKSTVETFSDRRSAFLNMQ